MFRRDVGDLIAFLAIARERSFTRAAAGLGVSSSALSHTLRGLEERLGVQLLTRTTRSVAPTEVGERLISSIRPHVEGIEEALADLTLVRDKPAGTLRLVAGDLAAETILWPTVRTLRRSYPDIAVEIDIDNGLTDIVGGRYHAGIRLGERVDKDMIAVRISPDLRMAVVGAPSYFDRHQKPRAPKDLTQHDCINIRLPTLGGNYVWEFEKGGKEAKVRVHGPLAFNASRLAVEAALAGNGLTFTLEDRVRAHINSGKLIRVLADWCPPFDGFFLYYPSRRHVTPVFKLLVEALRRIDPI
jgi:DNA-binding transcriptional LysR family regulator